MVNKHDAEFDPSKPALVLIYGNSNKKHRMLDRDVIVIGRARGCDLGLDAPDISSIHCLINRGPGGYHVRDCQSRAGTKLNGNSIREGPLRDGDLLQIGPFSFRAHLPGAIGKGSGARRIVAEHVQRSRRNLARIALRQRKMLRLQRSLRSEENGKQGKGQLTKQLETLKARIREFDKRARTMEDAERELAKERETFDQEVSVFRERAQQQEQAHALQRDQADAEALKAMEELSRQQEQRQRDLDALAKQLQHREQQLKTRLEPVESQERQLKSLHDELARKDREFSQQIEALEREQKEFVMKRDQWAQDQKSILNRVGQQKAALAQAEETLQQQRHDLDELLAVLQEGQLPTLGAAADPEELLQLRTENEELRKLLEEQTETTVPTGDKMRLLQRENDDLRRRLAESANRSGDTPRIGADDSSEEANSLRKLLEERDSQIEQLRAQRRDEPIQDVNTYEAELNQFRRQLETDRQKLNKEIEQLRAKNKELDEATRELELEMSRERAEMARERQRLDRMREDVRQDVERMQRESGLRDRLAPVQNLREHINKR